MLTPTLVLLLPPLFLVLHALTTFLRNPLRRFPAAHPLAPYTSLWIAYARWRGRENATLRAAHAACGPVVCVGPREVSVNCVKGGVRDVYAGGMEKGVNGTKEGYNWYGFFANFGGVDNMFSTAGNKFHAARKRMISNIYSKSVVTASPALLAQTSVILHERFLPFLAATTTGETHGVLNITSLVYATTMDIVTAYIFGLRSSSNLIDDPPQLAWFLDLYNSRRSYTFWPQEFPGFTAALEKWFGYRLVPRWVDEANGEIEMWCKKMCNSAANTMQQSDTQIHDVPTVYRQLSTAVEKEAKKNNEGRVDLPSIVASEVLDHFAAGFDTSGITLTYVVHELSLRKDIQHRLQQELSTLSPRLVASSSPSLPDPKTVDALPVLHAIIWETLRLHSAIPGPQPRFTPPQGCRLGPEGQECYVPGGVRVSASAGLLHQNEDVYARAAEWLPERWLDMDKLEDDKRKDMESRWFWAFGSGGRMCVGSHLAVYQMKYIVAALYSNYSTTIVDDTGIEQSDAYTAPPKSDKLMIQLEKLDASCM